VADGCDIRIGQFSVGWVRVLPDHVRGEGGPRDPRLVLPIELRLRGRPTDQQIAVTRLGVSIHLGDAADERSQVGPTVFAKKSALFFVSTAHDTPYPDELRFRIDRSIVIQLEEHRHKTEHRDFVATLRIETAAAWVYRTGNSFSAQPAGDRRRIARHPIDPGMGRFSVLAPFWQDGRASLTLRVPASHWVQQVLPGLGLDRYRMIEIALPSQGGPLPDDVITYFDEAREAYDQGRYRECIQKCRDVRYTIEQHLGATKQDPVATVVVRRLGLPKAAPQHAFLNGMWRALAATTSASHHVPHRQFPEDARACLHMTALPGEYLQALLTMPRGR